MKVAIIYNDDMTGIINPFGIQNKEIYSPKTVKKVAAALEQNGHNIRLIDGNMHVIESLQDFMPKVVEGEKMGMVFNMAYGIQGESRYTHIPSMLEMLGIPYIGSSPAGHALALDKVITKMIMQQNGIPTPEFHVFNAADEDMSKVTFPVIVKPKMEAVSYGLKVVYDIESLRDAVKFVVTEFAQTALVEQFIPGREFCVGILGNSPVETLPILEIDLENDPDAIQTSDDKKKKPREKICPADISEDLAKQMRELSINAFKVLQLRDFSRVDIRVDRNNNVYLLEINSMASLGQTGSYVYAARAAGYDYAHLVNKILDTASVRYFSEYQSEFPTGGRGKKVPLEVRIRSFLRGREPQIEQLIKDFVSINTHTKNISGVNEFTSAIKKHLNQIQFSCETFPQVDIGNISLFSNSEGEEFDCLFLGSLDNSIESYDQEHFRSTQQRFYGTGLWTHKGGIVAMIAALQALRFVKHLNKVKIGILLVSDDVLQNRNSRDLIQMITRRAKRVVGLHGGGIEGSVVSSRSGSALYRYDIHTTNIIESEQIPEAVTRYIQLLKVAASLSQPQNGLLVAPSKVNFEANIMDQFIHGKTNLSVRFDTVEQLEEFEKKTLSSLQTKKKLPVKILFEGGIKRPPFQVNPKSEELLNLIRQTGQKLDIRIKNEHRWSSAAICYVDKNQAAIDGLGPVGIKQKNHSEYILRHSVLERASILAVVLSGIVSGVKNEH